VYLSSNPQITFWKGLYKRHTNFAMEPFRVNFTGQPAWGTKQSATLGRHADLLYSTYLEVHLPHYDAVSRKNAVYNNDQFALGYNLLKYVELEIGGQLIDRQYGEFLFLWDTLCSSTEQSVQLHKLIGAADRPQTVSAYYNGSTRTSLPSSATPSTVTAEVYGGTSNQIDAVTSVSGGTVRVSGQGTASPNQVFIPGTPAGCSAGVAGQSQSGHPTIVYVPLKFFYTRNPGTALPLIALQYHEVKINVIWNDNQTISGDYDHVPVPAQPVNAAIYVDYIYLDVEERRRMAQESHEYLIEQVQYNEDKGMSSYNNRIDLTFNHPVKELIWVVQPTHYRNCKVRLPTSAATGGARWGPPTRDAGSVNATSVSADARNLNRLTPFTYDQVAVREQWLQINGQDRMDRRFGDYYNKVQPYQHHTGSTNTTHVLQVAASTPTALPQGSFAAAADMISTGIGQLYQPGIYSYSFALKPEEHQPSGTCNFSRIDTATLVMTLSGDITVDQDTDATWDVRVYAINYNVLRIMSGMAGLAYSN
jgi:hypothetical protein